MGVVTKTYRIDPANLGAFEKKMRAMTKKADKLGCESVGHTELGKGVEFKCRGCGRRADSLPVCACPRTNAHGDRLLVSYDYVEVAVFGNTPKFNGYTFAATIEHLSEGLNLVRSIKGVELPVEYRSVKPKCEHCKLSRHRKDTFVMLHEDGTLVQVGRQCVRDFLGGQSPENIAEMATFVLSLGGSDEDGDSDGFGGRCSYNKPLAEVLGYTVREVAENGYRAKSSNNPPFTSDLVYRTVNGPYDQHNPRPTELTVEELAKASLIVEYFAALEPKSDYEHNVCTIAKLGYVKDRHYGYAVSLVSAYERAMGREASRKVAATQAAASEYFGTVGKREVFKLTLTKVVDIDTQYGTLMIHLFADPAGNIAKWATTSTRLDVGTTYSVKATVKKHEEFKGAKQTCLSRAVAEPVVEVAA